MISTMLAALASAQVDFDLERLSMDLNGSYSTMAAKYGSPQAFKAKIIVDAQNSIPSEKEFTPTYNVAGRRFTKLLANVVDQHEWTPFHSFEQLGVRYMFLAPLEEFSEETLSIAMDTWPHLTTQDGKLTVYVNPSIEDIPVYLFYENNKILVTDKLNLHGKCEAYVIARTMFSN